MKFGYKMAKIGAYGTIGTVLANIFGGCAATRQSASQPVYEFPIKIPGGYSVVGQSSNDYLARRKAQSNATQMQMISMEMSGEIIPDVVWSQVISGDTTFTNISKTSKATIIGGTDLAKAASVAPLIDANGDMKIDSREIFEFNKARMESLRKTLSGENLLQKN
ncbi:MAG: hypothetical protein JW716_03480 [Candidatus Aenigmarchaeota archaeon]|nr:hypothetical protein [Candidatus Aenigmarchaeota archaeon]